jgi:hypothetical protein
MYSPQPTPTLIVDTWSFRLVDPDGNLIGKYTDITTLNAAGVVIPLPPAPGVERMVQALPDE